MTFSRVVFCSLALINTGVAGEVVDWPSESKTEWATVRVDQLPAGVKPRDPEDSERTLTTVRVRKVDVDGDGAMDLIVDIGRGGSGGSYVYIYRGQGKRFHEVLGEQGGIVVPPKSKGVVECWSRIGGVEYRRTVYRFNGKRFEKEQTEVLRHRADDRFDVIEKKKP